MNAMTMQALAPWADTALHAAGPRLAYELAANLRPMNEILMGFGLSQEQFDHISRSPWFVSMLDEARVKWATQMAPIERIRLKAMVALEDSLHVPYTITHDADAPAAARLEAIKTMERLAGVVPVAPTGAGQGESGPKFSITIDLGEGKSVSATYAPSAQGAGGEGAPVIELDSGAYTQDILTPEVSVNPMRDASVLGEVGVDGSMFAGG